MKLSIAGAFLILLSLTSFAQAESCAQFAGKWKGLATGGAPSDYSELTIDYDPAQSVLSIHYNSDSQKPELQFTESYVADGKMHQGDGRYTGISYSASCQSNAVAIVRNFRELIKPLDTSFTLDGAELKMKSVIEGGSREQLGNFIRE